MAKSDNALTIAGVAAKCESIGQARAALGKCADLLREGYEKLPDVTSIADVRQAASDLLDVVNAYAQGIYATLPADDASQSQPVDFKTGQRVALALAQSQDGLKSVEDAASQDFWDIAAILTAAIEQAAKWLGSGVQKITNAAGRGLWAFLAEAWPTVLIVAVGVAVFLWWRYFRRRSV